MTVIGTRPQFIKYAAISSNIRSFFNEILVDTGQHYSKNLSDLFKEELKIPSPNFTFKIGEESSGSQVSEMILKIDRVISSDKPDYILCFGDTNSALSAAIAALKNDIPIIHIEGGERNFDSDFTKVKSFTIPEEANRILIDNISSLILCSSHQAIKNLNEEKISADYYFTGDITFDLYLDYFKEETTFKVLNRYGLQSKDYLFCTVHRALNTDSEERMISIVQAILKSNMKVVFPIHPRTKKMLEKFDLMKLLSSNKLINIIDPITYQDSISLNYHASIVLTDSGGVIREAYFNNVPAILLDDTTEWIELVKNKYVSISGASESKILEAIHGEKIIFTNNNLLGEGDSSQKILEVIKNWIH